MTARKGIPQKVIDEILVRSKRRCPICVQAGDTEPKVGDLAHLVSLQRGGTNVLDNLVFLCPMHHRQLDQKGPGALSVDKVKESRDKLYHLIEHEAKEVISEFPRVFLIHGRDEKAKEQVVDFLTRLGLEATVLSEKPNFGWTIQEKLERYANVNYAIAILSPEDFGTRARQNVVFELGFFVGRLGRSRVSALVTGDVELPSSFQGAMYIKMDERGSWQEILLNELVGAGLPIIGAERKTRGIKRSTKR